MLKEGRNREKAVRKNRNLFTRNKLCGIGKETFRIEFSRFSFQPLTPCFFSLRCFCFGVTRETRFLFVERKTKLEFFTMRKIE